MRVCHFRHDRERKLVVPTGRTPTPAKAAPRLPPDAETQLSVDVWLRTPGGMLLILGATCTAPKPAAWVSTRRSTRKRRRKSLGRAFRRGQTNRFPQILWRSALQVRLLNARVSRRFGSARLIAFHFSFPSRLLSPGSFFSHRPPLYLQPRRVTCSTRSQSSESMASAKQLSKSGALAIPPRLTGDFAQLSLGDQPSMFGR